MKKRKELDALVQGNSSGKNKRILNNKQKHQGKTTESKVSAHKLLGNDSESSDMDDFSILNGRRVSSKKSGRTLCTASCFPLCLVVLVTTCIVALGTLLWLHLGLREDLDLVRAHLQKVEAQNKETPEALHDYHIQLKNLEFNVSSFGEELKRLNIEISSISEEFKQLKLTTNGLKESIAAAPEIKNLPKDVMTVTQTAATLGSKMTLLESTVAELKQQQTTLKESTDNNTRDHLGIKASVSEMFQRNQDEIATRNSNGGISDQLMAYVHKEVLKVSNSVDDLNSTLHPKLISYDDNLSRINESVNWAMDDLKSLHTYVYTNLSRKSADSGEIEIDQTLQKMISEALSSTDNPKGSWQDVLQEASQMSLLYIDISRKVSGFDINNTSNKQKPIEQLLNVLNEKCIQDVQLLNNSISAQSVETKTFEKYINESIRQLNSKTDNVTLQLAKLIPPSDSAATEPKLPEPDQNPTNDNIPPRLESSSRILETLNKNLRDLPKI